MLCNRDFVVEMTVFIYDAGELVFKEHHIQCVNCEKCETETKISFNDVVTQDCVGAVEAAFLIRTMLISKTHSRAVLQVQIKLCLAGGDVEQPTAVQLALQVGLGLVFQHSPSRVQKCLLEKRTHVFMQI